MKGWRRRQRRPEGGRELGAQQVGGRETLPVENSECRRCLSCIKRLAVETHELLREGTKNAHRTQRNSTQHTHHGHRSTHTGGVPCRQRKALEASRRRAKRREGARIFFEMGAARLAFRSRVVIKRASPLHPPDLRPSQPPQPAPSSSHGASVPCSAAASPSCVPDERADPERDRGRLAREPHRSRLQPQGARPLLAFAHSCSALRAAAMSREARGCAVLGKPRGRA